MRAAVLDIGTNTILLLVADIDDDRKINTLLSDHAIPRIGRGINQDRHIQPENFHQAEKHIRYFLECAASYKPDKVIACGTSFLRDAANANEFIQHIYKTLGISIRVLSGDEEAEMTYLGAVSGLLEDQPDEHFIVIDIGGGSTEFTFGKGKHIEKTISLNIGSVRITERMLRTSPPTRNELDAASSAIRKELSTFRLDHARKAIGVAGTLTTLAALDLGLEIYDAEKVNGYHLQSKRIREIFDELASKPLNELLRIPQILPGRSDVIVAGILILVEVLEHLKLREIIVSDRGLRYGIVFKEAGKS